MIAVREIETQQDWDKLVLDRAGHPLQLWGWGQVKAAHNWRVQRVGVYDDDQLIGAAQLLIRPLPWPFRSLVYVPRGPICQPDDRQAVLTALADHAKKSHHAVALTIEPDWEGELVVPGWHKTDTTILIPRTLILDLQQSADDLLAAMSKKTRQYIRKSGNESIEIRQVKTAAERDTCLAIYKQTAARAGFALHDDQYYHDIANMMGDHSVVTAAFQGDEPIAFLWNVVSASTVFELYGGMNDEGQRLRANYALKWQTIRMVQDWGVVRYDMNGLLNDGVSTFKQGFAGHENQLVGTYDRPLSLLYTAWHTLLPLGKKLLRKLKNR